MPPVALNVLAGFEALVASAVNSFSSPDLLFPAGSIYRPGQLLDLAQPIIASVSLGRDNADELESTSKLLNEITLTCRVIFDGTADPAFSQGDEISSRHLQHLSDIITAVHADRSLGGYALDTCIYVGGGTELELVSVEGIPGRWAFNAAFRAQYRHLVTDPETQI